MSTNMFNPSDKRFYPARWKTCRGKQLFQVIDERSLDGNEELLSVSHITGITPRKQKNVTMFQSESLVGYKICRIGDIAANTMWTWQGAIGVSSYFGVISPAYNVYRQIENVYNGRYLDLLLRERKLIDVYHSLSTGIRPSRLRLYPEVFLTIDFPVPPREEQDQIVRFLDWKLSEINRLIALENRTISILMETMDGIIDKAVIHGLHDTKTKHSNDIRWEIDYPEHWTIARTREHYSFRKGLSITKANLVESGIAVISYGQVHSKTNTGVGLNETLIRFVDESYLETGKSSIVEKGDFIFADTSEDLTGCGNCVYIDSDDTIFAGYHSIIMHPDNCVKGKYMAYLFKSPTWRYQIRKAVNAVKVYTISQAILKDAFILIPPTEEQEAITKYLDGECQKIYQAIELVKNKIQKLQEFKTRLISDVVTGKIDVRGIEIPEYEYTAEEADTDSEAEAEELDEEEE